MNATHTARFDMKLPPKLKETLKAAAERELHQRGQEAGRAGEWAEGWEEQGGEKRRCAMSYEIRPCKVCNKPSIRTPFGFSCYDGRHNVLDSGVVVHGYNGKPRLWSAHQQGIEHLAALFPEMKTGYVQSLEDDLRRERLSLTISDAEVERLKSEKAELLEALNSLLDCISETRGKDAPDAVAKARAVKAKSDGNQ